VVRFTDAAIGDLETMARKGDPQVVRWALKKCLLLERDPEAGEALVGPLIGYRKLTVGDRDWRIVWRVSFDDAGRTVVDVAEVWAIGARSDSEVYAEMRDRVAALSSSPETVPLAEVIERLGRIAMGIAPGNIDPAAGTAETAPPVWLRQALVRVVGLPRDRVAGLSAAEAHRIWDDYTGSAR
jgi:mRNA interferase RelE/StbE